MKQNLFFKALCSLAAMLMTTIYVKAQEPYAVLSDEGKTVTFYYDMQKESRGGVDIINRALSYNESSPYGDVTTAVIDPSFANYRPTSTAYWFRGCQFLTTIMGMENLKTDNVTDMREMFNGCIGLTSLDVSGFKTDHVTDMWGLFGGCSNLPSLDVSGFKTDNVEDMSGMFYRCQLLTDLDVSGFKTDNVKDMSHMFRECFRLTSLEVSGFKTDNVTKMCGMFCFCSSLTNLDVSGFKTDNVTDMYWMFKFCSSLTSIDLSSFKTDNVTSMSGLFENCKSLTSLDLSSFNTVNVKDMDYMFYDCTDLITIYVGDEWSTENVSSWLGRSNNMFTGCIQLVGGEGTTFSEGNDSYKYAHIDGGADSPGYFTKKDPTCINGIRSDRHTNIPVYDILGQKLIVPKKGINIIDGKKMVVK